MKSYQSGGWFQQWCREQADALVIDGNTDSFINLEAAAAEFV
jgi:hypothetical protein